MTESHCKTDTIKHTNTHTHREREREKERERERERCECVRERERGVCVCVCVCVLERERERERKRERDRERENEKTDRDRKGKFGQKFFLVGKKHGEMKLQTERLTETYNYIIYLKKTGPKFLRCSFRGASKFFTKLPVMNTNKYNKL